MPPPPPPCSRAAEDAKFGPAPPRALTCRGGGGGAYAAAVPPMDSRKSVLAMQLVGTAVLLAAIQPPFVMNFQTHGDGVVARLSPVNVAVVSACAVGVTVWLERSFKLPSRF